MIFYISHIDIEGPGLIGTYLRIPAGSRTVRLGAGERLPSDLTHVSAVVCLGGPMNVYEEERFPFLKEENGFIRKVLDRQIPFLGICLGSQLLAKCAGARVVKSPVKEIGWHTVRLIDSAARDPLFKGLGTSFDVFQWHEDTFEIPANGVLLAQGGGCPNQAFKLGENAYGMQFHFEVTEGMVRSWGEAYWKDDPAGSLKMQKMLEHYGKNKGPFEHRAETLCRNFASLIR